MKKSAAQGEREARLYGDRTEGRARRRATAAERAEVKVYRGAPFAAAGSVAVVDQEAFAPLPVVPQFDLTPDQREQILNGGLPRIAFPRLGDMPISIGEVYEITPRVKLIVTGIGESVTHRILHYEVLDERPAGVRFNTSKAREKEADRMGGPEFRAEREPEAVKRREATKMAEMTRDKEAEKLRSSLKKIKANLQDLEEQSQSSEIVWGMKKTIKAIETRIARIETINRANDEKAA